MQMQMWGLKPRHNTKKTGSMKNTFSMLWHLRWKTYVILPNVGSTYVNVVATMLTAAAIPNPSLLNLT